MRHRRYARIVTPLLLVAASVHLAGFVAPSLEGLLAESGAPGGCGCGDDCTCGCGCCGDPVELPSCCSAPTAMTGGAADMPVWTAACACGGRGDGHLLYRTVEPADVTTTVLPRTDRSMARANLLGRAGLPFRPCTPDDPVPRFRS